ncbi:MAG: aldo/keto reductase [Calditrichaeota bacterium]|nr:MAG: aldo/keto reductase [Calditrichota bacterium]
MKFKLLGKSGLRVSEICLGTMTFGEDWGWGVDRKESKKIFDAFAEAGGNFIDTANYYTNGTSEKFLGEFISAEREKFVLATKFTLAMRKGDPNSGGNHRKNILQSVEASLKRLNTDYIDLLWLHAWDFTTPVSEVMRTLNDLVSSGKVLYIGISDSPAWVVSQANTLAELRSWIQFTGLQVEYNLLNRDAERDLLPMANEFGITTTAWAPLASGILTGRYNKDANSGGRIKADNIRLTPENITIAEEVVKIAGEIGAKPSQVAINWIRQQSNSIIPILGASKTSQLVENLGCLDFFLTPEHLKRLHKISRIQLGFPHDFLRSARVREIITGGTDNLIEKHRK